jgi:hypothetical protein
LLWVDLNILRADILVNNEKSVDLAMPVSGLRLTYPRTTNHVTDIVTISPDAESGPGLLLKAKSDVLALDVHVDFTIHRPVITPTTEAMAGIIVSC